MLLRKVEKFLRDHEMPATKFGRLAAHDPRFVLDLRMGRIPRAHTEARTLKWMQQFEASAGIGEPQPAAEGFETKGRDARQINSGGYSYAA